jgi:hypothetical protein
MPVEPRIYCLRERLPEEPHNLTSCHKAKGPSNKYRTAQTVVATPSTLAGRFASRRDIHPRLVSLQRRIDAGNTKFRSLSFWETVLLPELLSNDL